MLGAMLVAMLPGTNAMAQSKSIALNVRTVDHATLDSAWIVAGTTAGSIYFIDSAHLDAGYTGDLVWADTAEASQALTIGADGYSISGTVDSLTFGLSAIVARDMGGNLYVLANATASNRQQGVFLLAPLFATTAIVDNGGAPLTGQGNMLMPSSLTARDNDNWSYTTLAGAIQGTANTVYLLRNLPAEAKDTINRAMTLNLNGDTMLGSLHLCHSNGVVVLTNGRINVLDADETGTTTIVINDIDIAGNFIPRGHVTTINDGRFNWIDTTGSTLFINGGKFNQRLPKSLFGNKTFGPNPDEDAAQFAYKVVDGHSVTWVNWDYLGNDTTIVYNESDRKIRPVLPSRPNYTDTLFFAWYVDNGTWQTPWSFLTDELVSDTNLYARWEVIDRTLQTTYSVRHRQITLAGDTVTTDSITYIGKIDTTVVAYPVIYYGFHPSQDSIVIDNLTANDTVLTFIYARDTFQITWWAVDGVFPDHNNFQMVFDSLRYGDTINYSLHVPYREGFTHTGWSLNLTTMPAQDLTISAQYLAKTYPVSWTGDNQTVVYNSLPVSGIVASYTNDTNLTLAANLVYIKGNDTIYSPEMPVNAGIYTIYAVPINPAYHLGNNTTTLTILPATVTISGIVVDSIKYYDGSDTAHVSNLGAISGVQGSDLLSHSATAWYTDANVGTGKDIIVAYLLAGDKAINYSLSKQRDTVTHNGVILTAITPDTAREDNGIDVDATGYCAGNGAVRYYLSSGNPDQYKLTFNDAAFTNVDWTPITTPGSIDITVPAGVVTGDYTATLVFGNSAYPQIESAPISITFHVNLPETYTMPLFSDVIALVDTCHCFTDIQWYHRESGETAWTLIPGATGHYYQQVGGLTGEYRVSATMAGVPTFTCPQTDVTTLISDEETPDTKVSAYPNPATDRVVVSIDNSMAERHTLRVMSIMGLTLESTTFDGNSTTVDMSQYQSGNYVVSVDGIVVRVIKK